MLAGTLSERAVSVLSSGGVDGGSPGLRRPWTTRPRVLGGLAVGEAACLCVVLGEHLSSVALTLGDHADVEAGVEQLAGREFAARGSSRRTRRLLGRSGPGASWRLADATAKVARRSLARAACSRAARPGLRHVHQRGLEPGRAQLPKRSGCRDRRLLTRRPGRHGAPPCGQRRYAQGTRSCPRVWLRLVAGQLRGAGSSTYRERRGVMVCLLRAFGRRRRSTTGHRCTGASGPSRCRRGKR